MEVHEGTITRSAWSYRYAADNSGLEVEVVFRPICLTLLPNSPSSNVAPEAQRIEVYGYARGESVDALLVRVDGEALRDNGTPFHITLSVAPGHKPVEAGALADRAISAGDYTRVEPFEIDAIRF